MKTEKTKSVSISNLSMKGTLRLIVTAVFCQALWGMAPSFIKMGYQTFAITKTSQMILFAGMRFFLSGLMVLAYFLISERRSRKNREKTENREEKGKREKREDPSFFQTCAPSFWKHVCILAVFQTIVQYIFYYLGAYTEPGAVVSVLSGLSAFFALAISAWIFKMEKMTALKLAGCLLGFAGIVYMNKSNMDGFLPGIGMVYLLISQISSSFSSVLIKRFSAKSSAVALSGCQFTLGGLVLIIFGLVFGGGVTFDRTGILILLVLACISAGAYTLWGVLLKEYPVSRVSIFGCLMPLFGVLFSWMFLGESIGVSTVISLALVVLGIFCVNFGMFKKD